MADVNAQRNHRSSGGLLQRHDFAGAVARFWQVYNTSHIFFSLSGAYTTVADVNTELLCPRLRGHFYPAYHVHSCMITLGAKLASPIPKAAS